MRTRHWDMQPEAATRYFENVVKQFDQYAKEDYPPLLDKPDSSNLALIAGLRYVETRRETDHEDRIREIFTSQPEGPDRREVLEACLDALVATTEDVRSTALFLADVGSRRKPLPASNLCSDGLTRLDQPAFAAVLELLGRELDGVRRRKLALLLARASKVPPPEPLRFWDGADEAERAAAIEVWRAEIVEKAIKDKVRAAGRKR